jgi:exodeoxyribonuclease VII small subunit
LNFAAKVNGKIQRPNSLLLLKVRASTNRRLKHLIFMKKKNSPDIPMFSYDDAMIELQNIVSALQNEAVSVDDLAENTERAALLIKLCREKLRQTEGEIQKIFGGE